METIGWKPRFKSWSSLALFVFNSKLKRQNYSLDQSFRFFLEFKLEESGSSTTVVLLFTEHKGSGRFRSMPVSYCSSPSNCANLSTSSGFLQHSVYCRLDSSYPGISIFSLNFRDSWPGLWRSPCQGSRRCKGLDSNQTDMRHIRRLARMGSRRPPWSHLSPWSPWPPWSPNPPCLLPAAKNPTAKKAAAPTIRPSAI